MLRGPNRPIFAAFTGASRTVLLVQLRDMVPPQSPNSAAQDGLDSKRPKHVVLSDTIQLIRDLQHKVAPG